MRYANTIATVYANVVARALKGYAVEVVDDAGERLTHLHHTPGPKAHEESETWFRDVSIDKGTELPIRDSCRA